MAFGSSWLDRVAGPSRLHSVSRVSDHVQDRHTSSVTIKELITMNLSREESQWQRRKAPSGPACDCSSSSSDSTTDTNNNNLPSNDNVKHCTTMSDTPASPPPPTVPWRRLTPSEMSKSVHRGCCCSSDSSSDSSNDSDSVILLPDPSSDTVIDVIDISASDDEDINSEWMPIVKNVRSQASTSDNSSQTPDTSDNSSQTPNTSDNSSQTPEVIDLTNQENEICAVYLVWVMRCENWGEFRHQ